MEVEKTGVFIAETDTNLEMKHLYREKIREERREAEQKAKVDRFYLQFQASQEIQEILRREREQRAAETNNTLFLFFTPKFPERREAEQKAVEKEPKTETANEELRKAAEGLKRVEEGCEQIIMGGQIRCL